MCDTVILVEQQQQQQQQAPIAVLCRGGAEPPAEPPAVLCRGGAEPPAEPPSIESQFNSLLQDLSSFKLQLSDIQTKVRSLEKHITKELKSKGKTEKKQTTLKLISQTGFNKAVPISDELCVFLSKPLGTSLSRTEVTQFITNYIRDHKLQDMSTRKLIQPNEALFKLLHLKSSDEEVTYFNLQKYLNIHFTASA